MWFDCHCLHHLTHFLRNVLFRQIENHSLDFYVTVCWLHVCHFSLIYDLVDVNTHKKWFGCMCNAHSAYCLFIAPFLSLQPCKDIKYTEENEAKAEQEQQIVSNTLDFIETFLCVCRAFYDVWLRQCYTHSDVFESSAYLFETMKWMLFFLNLFPMYVLQVYTQTHSNPFFHVTLTRSISTTISLSVGFQEKQEKSLHFHRNLSGRCFAWVLAFIFDGRVLGVMCVCVFATNIKRNLKLYLTFVIHASDVQCTLHEPLTSHHTQTHTKRNRNRKDGRKPQKPKLCNTLRLLPFYYRWNIFFFWATWVYAKHTQTVHARNELKTKKYIKKNRSGRR